jgi:hypothetical protein
VERYVEGGLSIFKRSGKQDFKVNVYYNNFKKTQAYIGIHPVSVLSQCADEYPVSGIGSAAMDAFQALSGSARYHAVHMADSHFENTVSGCRLSPADRFGDISANVPDGRYSGTDVFFPAV